LEINTIKEWMVGLNDIETVMVIALVIIGTISLVIRVLRLIFYGEVA